MTNTRRGEQTNGPLHADDEGNALAALAIVCAVMAIVALLVLGIACGWRL